MNDAPRWKLRIALGLFLLLAGAAAATWLLGRSQPAAEFFGVASEDAAQAQAATPFADAEPALSRAAAEPPGQASVAQNQEAIAAVEERETDLEARIARLEASLGRAEGSAGRADALLVAFAARRAIERGVPLGYLEPLLVERFGPRHEAAVARIITASRDPVRLEELVESYRALGPVLRSGDPEEGAWQRFKRGLSDVVSIYPADQPSPRPQARYERALVQLRLGEVESALSETLRLPGAANAREWVGDARRYIATRQALDIIESAALLSREENASG